MSIFKIFIVSTLSLFILATPAIGQESVDYSKIWERFSESNLTSKSKINHDPLTDYLSISVLVVGRSKAVLGNGKPASYRNSRIKTAEDLSPSRYEGSRLLIHDFTDDHKDFFLAYQEGLELVSARKPLKKFNKNEQLAFWLNLYNVIVINKLIDEYPINNLKSLRSTNLAKKTFWTKKTTTIEGVPLSLIDIEKILFNNFNSPLVVFGLFQGSIGGPRLRNEAYSSSNVWSLLESNAVEFINSNRGLRPPKGQTLTVSKFYKWVLPAFGTSKDHVLRFIKTKADPNFIPGVDNVSSLNFKIYNWQIADVMGGTKHTGGHNQMGGILTGQSTVVGAPAGVGGTAGGLMDSYKLIDNMQKKGYLAQIPDIFFNLLVGIQQNSQRPTPVITTEECAPGEEC